MKSTNLELILSLPFLDRKKYVLVPPSNQENNEKSFVGFLHLRFMGLGSVQSGKWLLDNLCKYLWFCLCSRFIIL